MEEYWFGHSKGYGANDSHVIEVEILAPTTTTTTTATTSTSSETTIIPRDSDDVLPTTGSEESNQPSPKPSSKMKEENASACNLNVLG